MRGVLTVARQEFRMRLRGITSGSAAALTVPTTKGDVQRYGR